MTLVPLGTKRFSGIVPAGSAARLPRIPTTSRRVHGETKTHVASFLAPDGRNVTRFVEHLPDVQTDHQLRMNGRPSGPQPVIRAFWGPVAGLLFLGAPAKPMVTPMCKFAHQKAASSVLSS